MVIIGYLLLCFIFIILAFNKFHRLVNLVSVFTVMWFFWGALSCLGFFNLRVPSFNVHLLAWIFVSIVDFCFLLFAKNNYDCCVCDLDGLNCIFRAHILQALSLSLLIPLMYKTASLYFSSTGLAAIRNIYFSGTNFSSMYQDLFFRLIPMGFTQALIIIYVYYSFETKQYKYLIYSFLNVILITLISGGRYALMLILYTVLILWLTGQINIGQDTFIIKYKNKLKKIILLIVVVMFAITLKRGQAILNNVYMYFSGSLSFLDYILENPSSFALDKPLHGYLTFGAIVEPVVLFLKVIGLTTAKVPSYEFNIYCQNYYNIGANGYHILFNANTSVLYYFIRDFGFFGVIIGALFFGIVATYSYNRWKKGSIFWGLIFIFVGNAMLNSIMTYQLFGPNPFFMCCAFYLLTQRKFTIGKGRR